MENYPIFVKLQDQPCLVVGGGEVALRKIRLLQSAGAKITVIAPDICKGITQEFGPNIQHNRKKYEDSDIGNYRLITAATNDVNINAQVSARAQALNIPVNVVDQPELCSFITPSIIDRSPVILAISTGGSAPVLARQLRSKLESLIPAGYGRLALTMRKIRDEVKTRIVDEKSRRLFWEKIVHGPIAEKIFLGQITSAETELQALIDTPNAYIETGAVWLIGAGPGDPDLLTFRALRLMQQADIVLYDRLVSDDVLNLCRRDAERIYVGKKRSDHSLEQTQINQLLVDLAKQGNRVVRLKGGDPFIFGRGGEEIDLLSKSNIPFQVVPGITAASGCATYAGIPLTHRDHAQSCLFVTGHLKDGTVDLDWYQLATPNQTVVIYMGLIGLPIIAKELIKHGVDKNMDIALIEQGTTPQQRVFTGTLNNIVETIERAVVRAPTLIIIGTVVQLRKDLVS
jgi:uroporphyrin-III C-methyltransferase/precorrin-2 dehydrogenase/sirohydrochlorin ferrochelatase